MKVENISKEATVLIAKAAEYFLAKFAEDSYKISTLNGRYLSNSLTFCPLRLREPMAPQGMW